MERSDLDEVNDLLDEWFRGEGTGKGYSDCSVFSLEKMIKAHINLGVKKI
jgi:hypothetical protein